MSIIKWVLITAGGLFMLSIAGCLGIAGYYGSASAEQLSLADLSAGSDFRPGERDTFVKGCKTGLSRNGASSRIDAMCECLADHGDSMSRFERLTMTAALNGDVRQVIGLAKGIVKVGANQDEIENMRAGIDTRLKGVLQRCSKS